MGNQHPKISKREATSINTEDITNTLGNPLIKLDWGKNIRLGSIRSLNVKKVYAAKHKLIFLADFLVAVVIKIKSSVYMRWLKS